MIHQCLKYLCSRQSSFARKSKSQKSVYEIHVSMLMNNNHLYDSHMHAMYGYKFQTSYLHSALLYAKSDQHSSMRNQIRCEISPRIFDVGNRNRWQSAFMCNHLEFVPLTGEKLQNSCYNILKKFCACIFISLDKEYRGVGNERCSVDSCTENENLLCFKRYCKSSSYSIKHRFY